MSDHFSCTMKKKITVIISLLSVFLYTFAQEREIDVFLNENMLKSINLKIDFINSIDCTYENFLLLASSNQFYALGQNSIFPIFEKTKNKIDVFSISTIEGNFLIISDKTLYRTNSDGKMVKIKDLPTAKMGIASDKDETYLFEQTEIKSKKEYALFSLSKNVVLTKIISTQAPVNSVLKYDSILFFTSQNKIYYLKENNYEYEEIFTLWGNNNKIISLAGDIENQALYFSTSDTVYRIKDEQLDYVCTDFGGILKYDGEGLLVFNPEKSLIVRLNNNILYPSVEEDFPPLDLSIDKTPENPNLTRLLNKPHTLILAGQISQAIQAYSQLIDKDNTNSALLSEYAYALALGGVYEGALMNLDRAKLFGTFSEKDYFYAGQVFALMNCHQSAVSLLTRSSVPKWLYPKYEELYQRHKSKSFALQENDAETRFNRANDLAATGMNFQSIALFEFLLKKYSNESVFHIGYSIPLENVGLPKLAAEELETGILLMPDDPKYYEAKQTFNQRLTQLRKQPENVVPKGRQKPNKSGPKTMLYAGGMFSEDYTSFNARFGVYLSNSFNGAVNLGVSGNSTATNFNIGLSGYQRLGNVLVLGLGLNEQINKDNSVLSIAPSLGFSFINSKRNASWDIFFNAYCPLQEGVINTYGISIGKSFYLGKR